MDLLTLFVLAILAESVWETLKMTWQKGKLCLDRVGALVVSLVICIDIKLDMLTLLGIKTTIPFIGIVLTAILISRGSNFLHDLLERIGQVKNK